MVLLTLTLAVTFGFSLLEFNTMSKKTTRVFFFVGTLLLFILIGLNRLNPDFEGYQKGFYAGKASYEFGYVLLSSLIRTIGLPFETIIFLMAGLLLAILWIAMKSHYSSWVIFFYMIFPLALDLPQIRNSLMYWIVILALLLLANRSRVAFFITVLVSATFHYLGAIYLPFTFLIKIKRKPFFHWLGVLTALLFLGVIGLRIVNAIWPIHPEIAKEIKPFDRFFFATQLLEIGIDLFTFWWVDQKIRNKIDPHLVGRMENLYRFGWYSILFLPLLTIHSQMYRFRRNAQLIKYIYSGIGMKYLNRKDQLILIGLILLNLALVVIFMIMANDHSVYTYFDNNWLIWKIQEWVK